MHSHQGFTLIEIIIYLGIVVLMMVAILQVAFVAQESHATFILRSMQHNTAFRILHTVDTLVRNSDGFVEDASGNFCFATTTLYLYFATSSIAYTPPGCLFPYASGAIGITEGTGTTAGGIVMTCYRNYPNEGLTADCTTAPSATDTQTVEMVDRTYLNVAEGGLRFATTTVGSQQAITTLLGVGIKSGYGLSFATSTLQASSTAAFRIDP